MQITHPSPSTVLVHFWLFLEMEFTVIEVLVVAFSKMVHYPLADIGLWNVVQAVFFQGLKLMRKIHGTGFGTVRRSGVMNGLHFIEMSGV